MLMAIAVTLWMAIAPCSDAALPQGGARVANSEVSVRDRITVGMSYEQLIKVLPLEKCSFFMSANSISIHSGVHKVRVVVSFRSDKVTLVEKTP